MRTGKISQLISLPRSLVYASNVNYRWSIGRFWTVYNLHRDVIVDEAMVPFKGKSTLKQYICEMWLQGMDAG